MAIAVASRVEAFGSGFSASVASPAQSHTAGRALVVNILYQQDPSFPTAVTGVTNTAGDTFTAVASRLALGTGNFFIEQWRTLSTSGHASDVVTVAFSGAFGAQTRGISVYECSYAGTLAVDDTDTGSAASGTTMTTPSLTVTGNAIIIAAGACPFFGGLSEGSGYTLTQFSDTTEYGDEYKLVSASEAATMGCADSAWGIVATAFKESAGGGVAPRTYPLGMRRGFARGIKHG